MADIHPIAAIAGCVAMYWFGVRRPKGVYIVSGFERVIFAFGMFLITAMVVEHFIDPGPVVPLPKPQYHLRDVSP